MSSRRKNTFARAVRHIKSTKFDVVEAAPVNSTSGLMTVTPNAPNPDYVPPNYPPAYKIPNFDTDTQDDGKDTTGLFAEDGTPKTSLPPVTESSPDRSYILGPMASMWYAWANATRVGYIRQSDRKMVNLGSITGKLSDWDGASGFTSYGQLTLEQTVWYKNVAKAPGQTNDPATANYRAFYPGPPSNSPDSNGRYYCTITGEPLDQYSPAEGEPKIPPVQGEMSPDEIFSALMDRLSKLGYSKLSKREKELLNKLGYLDTGEEDPQDDSQEDDTQQKPNNWDKFKDTLSKIGKGLWTAAEIVSFAKTGEILADLVFNPIVDTAFGLSTANSAGEYNTKLATSMVGAVVTGKNQQIHLSKEARIDLINNVDVKELEKYLKIGPPPKIGSDNAIKPGDGKSDTLLKGAWGNQGGVEINYDPNTGQLTITSAKMLRDFGNLDQKNAGGKVTNFNDIPNPTTDQVKNLFKQKGMEGPLKSFFNMVANAEISSSTDSKSFKPFAAGYDPDKAAEMMYTGLPEITKALYNFTVEGSASNAVHLRDQLIKAGISKSEIEKAGAGFGGFVYSKSVYTGGDMPKDLKKVVNKMTLKSMGQDYSYFENIIKSKGKLLSESKRSIIKNLKKPVVIPETKQKSYKVKPKIRGLENTAIVSKPVETPKEYKKIGGRHLWGQYEYQQNVRQSQERMNDVLELVGEGDQAFKYMITDSKRMNSKQLEEFWGLNPEMHSHFYNGKKYKVTRKEQLDGDHLVFLVDENGVKSNILQSELNEKLAEEDEKRLLDEYNKINPKSKRNDRISYDKDPLFKKAYKKLMSYKDKPAVMGYPNDPPPKMVNGWHPEYGKRYKYDKLDPISAKAMPPTGNPEIDANVEKAKRKPK